MATTAEDTASGSNHHPTEQPPTTNPLEVWRGLEGIILD